MEFTITLTRKTLEDEKKDIWTVEVNGNQLDIVINDRTGQWQTMTTHEDGYFTGRYNTLATAVGEAIFQLLEEDE